MSTPVAITKLGKGHNLHDFDCGVMALNRFLSQFAWQSQLAEASQTYLALAGTEIIGYTTLTVGSVDYTDAPERLKKGLARHPVPVIILARLAVATSWQGRGVAKLLLQDTITRTLNAADIAGIRALLVHAKDEQAKSFYEHFDFVASPTSPLHLFVLIKDLKKAWLKN